MVESYREYKVLAKDRQPLVDFMANALAACGCTDIKARPATAAPFKLSFNAPSGRRMGIVAYAFYANCKKTTNRPDDECRFQIKYGSEFGPNDLHEIWQDPDGLYTTLLVGISPEHGYFVAADPCMHNPTRFSKSIEYK